MQIALGVGAGPESIRVGDFNGDGQPDLITANREASTVSILLGRGDGSFEAAPDVGVGETPESITVGDFNGDGRQDLATGNYVARTVSILLGRGDGTFSAAPAVRLGAEPSSITTGDFDGDGRPDVATADFSNSVLILINSTPGMVVNDLVTFDPIPSTSTFTPDPTGCPAGFVGIFRFEARLMNRSERSLSGLMVAVTTITHGNLLHNADGGPGGVGARVTVPHAGDFADGLLSPAEGVDVPFRVCLTERQSFRFEVAVLGVAE